MRIKVTKADIKRGIKRSCSACPVTLAVKRYVKNKFFVSSSPYSISLGSVHYEIPRVARDFINAFDRGMLVEPMTFELSKLISPPQNS